ncbi:hypothetical protein RM697_02160 [Ichthyenterobacterium sp. W332]|uniref:DUF3188 domain-containing protein n=1 Tax=Microcosmobacter mediterraneus TaxID=3075607 RepID=A0ABU2YGY6_9FLAO|nr:hypothetical protein [Ichthyenterobacterium sp. W332]MDT0557434.1 hypothetical protein [Ichthyenterobacterium sp. W332]
MNYSRILSLLCILFGGAVAIYAQADADQNLYILIGGIVLLMLGLYRISRNIPSKNDNQDTTVTEDQDDEL